MVESTSQQTRVAARTPGEDDVQPRLRLRFALYTGLVLLGTGLAITWLVNREVENRAARTVESQARGWRRPQAPGTTWPCRTAKAVKRLSRVAM